MSVSHIKWCLAAIFGKSWRVYDVNQVAAILKVLIEWMVTCFMLFLFKWMSEFNMILCDQESKFISLNENPIKKKNLYIFRGYTIYMHKML